MSTQAQKDAMHLYCGFMEEIKVRVAAINAGTGGLLTALPSPIVREHCFLQFRFICELIALGCIAAHGDLHQTKKLKKEWAADKIMEEMEKLHTGFFPHPISHHPIPVGTDQAHHVNTEDKGLTKDGLIALYHECNDILHKGNITRLLKAKSPIRVHYPDIAAKTGQIVDLLANHMIATAGVKFLFICSMNAPEAGGGNVQVVIAENVVGGPPQHVKEAFDRFVLVKK